MYSEAVSSKYTRKWLKSGEKESGTAATWWQRCFPGERESRVGKEREIKGNGLGSMYNQQSHVIVGSDAVCSTSSVPYTYTIRGS